jgi:hypothetical protein
MHPLHAAVASFIDYAGLFPPAGLDLPTTVANHDRYAASAERWMLGRCVVPLARLTELATTLTELPLSRSTWTIAVLVSPTDRLEQVITSIDRFHAAPGTAGVTITAVEAALSGPDAVADAGNAFPPTLERFIEVPLDAARDAWLDAVSAAGCSAKIRTGGVTTDRFPTSESVAAVLRACATRQLALKATAGLHHAMRGAHRLTYEPGSAFGVMHGFVNLLVAALLLHTGAGTEADAQRALETRRPGDFEFDQTTLNWDGHSFNANACAHTRAHLLRSVGSCSFEEPVAELRALGWDPARG